MNENVKGKKVFLTARWENLLFATYKVRPDMLKPYIPQGLEPDTIDGNAFISLIAFDFLDIKVKGLRLPFNVNFPEINLRCYVKNSDRRGVVFIKELVPVYLTVIGANLFFNEKYVHASMKSEVTKGEKIFVKHTVKIKSKEYFIQAEAENKPYMPDVNSTENFFKEHKWGFGVNKKNEPLVYRVEHQHWEIYPIINFNHNFDFADIYGDDWEFLNSEKPYNITLAKGSPIKVFNAEKI
jgi:uncharacterized protein YqjF (DUF2071 family)